MGIIKNDAFGLANLRVLALQPKKNYESLNTN